MEPFRELLELSQRERRGLTFYVNGQPLAGWVVAILENGAAVEVRSQAHSRLIIRLDRVDAVALA